MWSDDDYESEEEWLCDLMCGDIEEDEEDEAEDKKRRKAKKKHGWTR